MSQSADSIIRRGPWRPRESTQAAWRRRYWRRGIVTALAVGLAGLLLLLLFRPFWHPNTKLVMVEGPAYLPGQTDPLAFAAQQRQNLDELSPALFHGAGEAAPLVVPALADRERIEGLGDQLQSISSGRSDVVMVYLAAHGIVVNDQACLMCGDFEATRPTGGVVPLQTVLRQLANSPARVKLLILDSGQLAYDPRQGVLVNEFPRRLEQEIADLSTWHADNGNRRGSPGVWVLNSNALLERSHISRALQRSVFGYFVSQGLKGPADLDGNQLIDVQELHRFVAAHTSHWVQRYTGGNESQTPLLLTTEQERSASVRPPVLLSITGFPKSERTLDLGRSLALARETSTAAAYFSGRSLPNEYSLTMQAASPLYSSGAGRTLLRGYYASRYVRASGLAGRGGAQIPGGQIPGGQAPGGQAPGSGAAEPRTAASGPAGEQGQGTEAAAAGDSEQAGGEQSAEPGISPYVAVVGQLLDEGWQLRDTLAADLRIGGVADFAPHRLRRFESEWLGYESVFRSGHVEDYRALAALLDRQLNLLRHVAGQTGESALPPDPSEIQAWRGRRMAWPAAHSLEWELAVSDAPNQVPDAVRQLAAELERLATAGSRDEFDKWLGERTETELRYVELQLARRLAAVPELPWPLLQQALRVRLNAERLAAVHPRVLPWGSEALLQADRTRREAERSLVQPLGADPDQYTGQLLARAEQQYERAASGFRLAQAAQETHLRWTRQLTAYARWRALVGGDAGGNAPPTTALIELARSLRALSGLLRDPDAESLLALQAVTGRIEQQAERVAGGLEPSGVEPLLHVPPREGAAWRLEALLETTLPEASLRSPLLAAGEQIDVQLAQSYQLPAVSATEPQPGSVSDSRWQALREQAELEVELCLLASDGLATAEAARTTLEQAWAEVQAAQGQLVQTSKSPASVERMWTACSRLGVAVRNAHAGLADQIRAATLENEEMSEPSARPSRLRAIRAAAVAQRFLSAPDVSRLQGVDPGLVLQRADYYDRLAWQLRRVRVAEALATTTELRELATVAAAYRDPPADLAGQPALTTETRPALTLESVESLSLISHPERDLLLTLRNNGTRPLACWLVVQTDPEVVRQVSAAESLPLYREPPQLLSAPEGTAGATAAPWTVALAAGESRSLRLRVERTEQPPREASLRIKVLALPRPESAADPNWPGEAGLSGMLSAESAPEANTLRGGISDQARYLRHVVQLQVPVTPRIGLRLVGQAGTWSRAGGSYQLHPFPNRDTAYVWALSNQAGKETSVKVQWFTPRQPPRGALPESELEAPLLDQLLAGLGPLDLLQTIEELSLPTSGEAVPLPFPAPPTEAAGVSAAGVSAAGAAVGKGAGEPAAGGAETDENAQLPPLQGPSVVNGLLCVVTNKATGRGIVRYVTVAAQRPRRYVRAEVGYRMNSEQLRVRVTGIAPELMPDTPVPVRMEFADPLLSDVQARLEGELQAPDYEAILYANIPARPRQDVTIRLHIDGYPRAFVYRVPCGVESRDLPEQDSLMEVRITAPAANRNYQAPVDSVRVKAQVDAPVRSFDQGEDFVEIGFDEDLDREFRGDQPMRFYVDRQLEARLIGLEPGGRMKIGTRVGDFDFDLPGRGLLNVRVNVLGRLQARRKVAWSLPVPVALDAAGPRLERVKTTSGNVAVIGQPLVISVWPDGRDMSGMGGLLAAFDVERTGEFPTAPPPIPGQPGPDGRWDVTLPTATLAPGKHTILLQAKDRVGNLGLLESYTIIAKTEEELKKEQETRVLVIGQVTYREQPVAGASVELQAADGATLGPVETDPQGRYRIQDVPVGSYRIAARGVVNNTPRFPDEPLTLDIQQGAPPTRRLDIAIRTNRPSESESGAAN